MGRLDGKVSIITGSGGGQGAAAARLFAAEGARVVVSDVKADDARAVVKGTRPRRDATFARRRLAGRQVDAW